MKAHFGPKLSRTARAIANTIASVRVDDDYIPMVGGLDLVTPPLHKAPGSCITAQNFYQATDGGYTRTAGYERCDGQAKPSDATFIILPATITGSPAVGNTLTGATSGATGTIIALPGGEFVLSLVTGTYVNGEALQVAAVTIATATDDPSGGASTPLLNAAYFNLAADAQRALILKVPGEGRVLGVVLYNDVRYAFRNAVGGLAAAVYKSSGSGWVAVPLLYEVGFTTGGAVPPTEGATLTQGGVTATFKRVAQTNAFTTWATNTATGRLIVSAPAGGNFTAGAATIGAVNVTLTGVQTAITLLPSGHYEFYIANFGGAPNTNRIYGCDGVNRGFEFDGTIFVPVTTGMTFDAPSHVKEHLKQLFFSFVGSAQHSAPGTPFIWSPILGAAELAAGDTITGFAKQPGSTTGGALAIFTRNRLNILYGTGVANWDLVPYRDEIGAYENSIQDIGKTVFLDDRGATDIQTTQAFGNFSHATLSNLVRPLMNEYRTGITASGISRDLSQYRLFFSSGYAFYLTIVNKKVVGIMVMFFPIPVRCAWSGEMLDGTEAAFFGSDDGYVYEFDKGTSFDGGSIEAYIGLAYNNSKSPRIIKTYKQAMLEIAGSAYSAFEFGFSLGYGNLNISQPTDEAVVADFSEGVWDDPAFVWDQFYWDGQTLMPAELDMEGDAENVALAIRSDSDMFESFTLTGSIIHFIPRRSIMGGG